MLKSSKILQELLFQQNVRRISEEDEIATPRSKPCNGKIYQIFIETAPEIVHIYLYFILSIGKI
jgi:hypothetical protein